MTPRIEDHAALGDGRTVALVSRGGTVDWLCWPRFDSPSLFGALLDADRGGAFRVAPTAPARPRWRYLDRTNVLETVWDTPGGRLTVVDWMPVASEGDQRGRLAPDHELLRLARCDAGEVDVEVVCSPRPDYGCTEARWHDAGPLGLRMPLRRALVTLRSTHPLTADGGLALGRFRLRAGERLELSLAFDRDAPAALAPLGPRVDEALATSVAWWRAWAARARYDGPHPEAVVRSALALRLLLYAPSGAIVAAPTTSLPERLGGDLNWDYRYCWLRDAAFTARALHGLGYLDEAAAFVSWCLHATRLTRPELRVLYDVYGRPPRRERILAHLPGHRGSAPVRVGNAAAEQRQLDVYGELVAAVLEMAGPGAERFDRETLGLLVDVGTWVCRQWDQPDHGVWEARQAPRHYTHSKLLGWKALDGLLDLHRRRPLPHVPIARFEMNRAWLRQALESRAFSPRLGSYTQSFDDDTVDAAALLVGWYGFHAPGDPRVRGTVDAVRAHLGCGPGLVYRYEQSREAGEGAFGICSFWVADVLARGAGTLGEARASFAATLRYANDLGLFAEEIDPRTGAALGNFPQGFTHVGLVNAALSIAARGERRRGTGPSAHGRPA